MANTQFKSFYRNFGSKKSKAGRKIDLDSRQKAEDFSV